MPLLPQLPYSSWGPVCHFAWNVICMYLYYLIFRCVYLIRTIISSPEYVCIMYALFVATNKVTSIDRAEHGVWRKIIRFGRNTTRSIFSDLVGMSCYRKLQVPWSKLKKILQYASWCPTVLLWTWVNVFSDKTLTTNTKCMLLLSVDKM